MAESHHPDYRRIYVTLLILLVISVAGPFLGIGWLTIVTAFGIAIVKANLVIQNFMHLKWERRIAKYVLVASAALLLLFYYGVASDVRFHRGQNWVNDAALAATARGIPAPHGAEQHPADDPPATDGDGTQAPGSPVPAFDAAATFATNCSPCHGSGGRGDGLVAASLNPRPADFTDPAFWRTRTDSLVVRTIREGGAAVGRSASMPAWSSLLSAAQAHEMAEYLRSLRR